VSDIAAAATGVLQSVPSMLLFRRCEPVPDAAASEAMFRTDGLSHEGEAAGPRRRSIRRLCKWAGKILIVPVIGLAIALTNNNCSFPHTSRAEFDSRLDSAIERALRWLNDHSVEAETNASLMYMVTDMERLHGDARLRATLDDFLTNPEIVNPLEPLDRVWPRMVHPEATVPTIGQAALRGEGFEYRWDAYAIAPQQVLLSDEDRAAMFSPTQHRWGIRDDQLLALVMYRHFNGSSDTLDRTINHLSEKVALTAHWDIRVTDFYIQRSAFVLAAGRPDLVRRRWIERILEYQLPDGSWNPCWHGWCRSVFDFDFNGRRLHDHPTVQAAWALYMLKYKYSSWIAQHYR